MITLKVTLNRKGEPAKVSGLKVTNATYVCTVRTSGTISKNLSGSAKVTKSGSGSKTSWVFNMQLNPATQTSFSGEVNRKGNPRHRRRQLQLRQRRRNRKRLRIR